MNFSDRSVSATAVAVSRGPASSAIWTRHLLVLGTLTVLLGVLNAEAIVAAVRVWWVSPTFSHCFLVIPVSAYFVWRRRHGLASLTPSAYPRALWLAPLLVLLSLVGKLASVNEAEQLALIGFLQVLILGLLGLEVYRKLLFPSLFLFFLVPMGGYLIGPLQNFTTHFISSGLTLLGIPYYTEGNIIQLSNGNYEVAEACAGLRFLVATIAIGTLYAHMTYRKWHKIVLYLAASLVVPVVANGFRALGIVLVAHWSDNRIAHGADHIIYGWGFLVAILLVLMVVGMRFADDPLPEDKTEAVTVPIRHPHALTVTVLLSLAAICFVPGLLSWQSHRPVRLDTTTFSAPMTLAGWETGAVSGGWRPEYPAPDAGLAFALNKAGSPAPNVDVFANYYASGKRRLVSSTNNLWNEDIWNLQSRGSVDVAIGGHAARLGEVVINSGGVTRIVWWTYWSHDRFTTSGLDVKLDHIRQALVGHGGSALLAVSTVVEVDPADARSRLRQSLSALGAIVGRLEQVARP